MNTVNHFESHLSLTGTVPSKKNKWRILANGRVGITDSCVRQQIESLILQARIGWMSRSPLPSFEITVHLTVSANNADIDNKLTTILDVLKAARVIVDDNITRCKRMTISGEVGAREQAEVWLTELEMPKNQLIVPAPERDRLGVRP